MAIACCAVDEREHDEESDSDSISVAEKVDDDHQPEEDDGDDAGDDDEAEDERCLEHLVAVRAQVEAEEVKQEAEEEPLTELETEEVKLEEGREALLGGDRNTKGSTELHSVGATSCQSVKLESSAVDPRPARPLRALLFHTWQPVEYYSTKNAAWIPARVLKQYPEQNAYMLDRQPFALASKVRSAVNAEVAGDAMGPSSPLAVILQEGSCSAGSGKCAPGHEESAPGDFVEYYSKSSGKWCPAEVLSFDVKSQTYDLDIKKRAIAERVRKATSLPSLESLEKVRKAKADMMVERARRAKLQASEKEQATPVQAAAAQALAVAEAEASEAETEAPAEEAEAEPEEEEEGAEAAASHHMAPLAPLRAAPRERAPSSKRPASKPLPPSPEVSAQVDLAGSALQADLADMAVRKMLTHARSKALARPVIRPEEPDEEPESRPSLARSAEPAAVLPPDPFSSHRQPSSPQPCIQQQEQKVSATSAGLRKLKKKLRKLEKTTKTRDISRKPRRAAAVKPEQGAEKSGPGSPSSSSVEAKKSEKSGEDDSSSQACKKSPSGAPSNSSSSSPGKKNWRAKRESTDSSSSRDVKRCRPLSSKRRPWRSSSKRASSRRATAPSEGAATSKKALALLVKRERARSSSERASLRRARRRSPSHRRRCRPPAQRKATITAEGLLRNEEYLSKSRSRRCSISPPAGVWRKSRSRSQSKPRERRRSSSATLSEAQQKRIKREDRAYRAGVPEAGVCPKTELLCAKTEATDDVPNSSHLMCPFRKLPDRELMCANPRCWFLVHTEEGFGGFCCRKCFWVLDTGSKSKKKHGPACEHREGPVDADRAEPIQPQD